jgi:Protein of unknown function (DUF3489)
MTRLSDTQLVILGAAAQRADLAVLPLPDTLRLKGGALTKVMDSLRNRGLIRVIGADGGPQRVVITSEGMASIGVEAEDETAEAAERDDYPTRGTPADQGAWAARRDDAARADEAAAPATTAKAVADSKGQTEAADVAADTGAAAPKSTPRAGTKQALMIDLLKRPEGATVEQIAEATGWQHHTIRGAISGALKKKLGLTVEATRTREVGPNKTGAKRSATTYRIVA